MGNRAVNVKMLASLCGDNAVAVATKSLTGIGAPSSMKAALLALMAIAGTPTVPTPSKLNNRPDWVPIPVAGIARLLQEPLT